MQTKLENLGNKVMNYTGSYFAVVKVSLGPLTRKMFPFDDVIIKLALQYEYPIGILFYHSWLMCWSAKFAMAEEIPPCDV